jgi:SAM-dependent methyltransferase
MRYLFGDSELAAARLEIVARVFEPATRAFLAEVDLHEPDLVIDLGCGPGHTTALLAEVLGPRSAVGLDLSEEFIERARLLAPSECSFQLHDVTDVPFPVGPADLLYCRYLLTHLDDPVGVLSRWADQVRGGGFVLLEEVEWIETNVGVLSRYLEILDEMLRSQSHALYIGSELERAPVPGVLAKRSSRVGVLPVSPQDAATMFAMNLPNWREQPFVRESVRPEEVDRLQRDLEELRERPAAGDAQIVWGLRQIVYERG